VCCRLNTGTVRGDVRTEFQFCYIPSFGCLGSLRRGEATPKVTKGFGSEQPKFARAEGCAQSLSPLAQRRQAAAFAPRTSYIRYYTSNLNTEIKQQGYFKAFCGRLDIGTDLGFELYPVFFTHHIMRMRFCEALCLCALASRPKRRSHIALRNLVFRHVYSGLCRRCDT
jgi:hypothetical protein